MLRVCEQQSLTLARRPAFFSGSIDNGAFFKAD